MAHKMLLVGSSNMDLSLNISRLPDVGETLSDNGGVSYSPGGGGANVAVALAKFGADAILVTRLGKDLYGQKLYNYYKESGINTSYIKVDKDYPTGFSVRIKESSGAERTLNFPGANDQVNQDSISEAFSAMPDGVFLNFESSFAAAKRTAKCAEQRGIPLFVDASPANANFPLDSLPYAEIFALSAEDTFRYTGIRPTGSQEALRAALNLARKVKARYFVINLGTRGAVIYDGKRCEVISPARIEKLCDTDGANDAFSAALSIEYLRYGDIKSAARYASAAYAITASRFGSSTSIPTDEEIRSFINSTRF